MAANYDAMTAEQLTQHIAQLKQQKAAQMQAQPMNYDAMSAEQLRQHISELKQQKMAQMQSQPQQPQQPQAAAPQQPLSSGTPSFLTPFIGNAEASGAAKQLAFNPGRAGKVAAASTLNTAQGLVNLIGNAYHYGSLGLSPKTKMNQDYNALLGTEAPQAGDALLALAPLMAAPEAIPTKGLGALGKLGARAAEGEAYGQAAGADTGSGAGNAALFQLPNLAVSAFRGRHAIPAALLKGTATAEERAANAAAAGDLPINIGQITQSPATNKFYENVVSEVPFSGVAQQQKKVAEGVQSGAEGLLNKAVGDNGSPLDPNELLKQRLLAAQNKARAAKNEQYNAVDALAQQEGHQLELPSFTSRASEVKDTIANSPMLQASSGLKSFMNKVAGYGEAATNRGPQDIMSALTGQRAGGISIRDANLAKNELYNMGQSLSNSAVASDRYMGGIYKELSGKISEDIKNSIKEKGSPQLQQAFDSANQEYRNNYAKFLNKDILKLLDKEKPADKFAKDIVKPGKSNDSYSNINLVQSLLPAEERNLLPAAYLSKAIDENGNVDTASMGKLLQGLGPRQFNALFSGTGLKKGAQDYRRLMEMSTNARGNMANPNTGAQLKQLLLGSGLLGAATSAPTAAAIAGGTIGASRFASNYLTNPNTRTKLLEAMSKRESGGTYGIPENEVTRQLLAAIPRAIAIQQSQQKRDK